MTSSPHGICPSRHTTYATHALPPLMPPPPCVCIRLCCWLQLTLPTRSTNMSFIKLTSQNKIQPDMVYEVNKP
jgi:hypothetical protein